VNTGVRTDLDSTIRAHPVESGDYLVSWVLIAEWLHTDGHRSLAMSNSEEMTPWLRRGIISDALDEEGWE
jgi:hypothetical protein